MITVQLWPQEFHRLYALNYDVYLHPNKQTSQVGRTLQLSRLRQRVSRGPAGTGDVVELSLEAVGVPNAMYYT